MRLNIASFTLSLVSALGGTDKSVMAAGGTRSSRRVQEDTIRLSLHHRLLRAEQMSAIELADCLTTIAAHFGLEAPSTETAQALLDKNQHIWSDYCSSNLKALESSATAAIGDPFEDTQDQGAQAQAGAGDGEGPTFFVPQYPEEEDVEILYVKDGYSGNTFQRIYRLSDRCNTNDEAKDVYELLIAEIADEAAEAACGATPFACPFAAATGLVLALWKVVVEGCALQDGLVDGAEIEATFENLKNLMIDEYDHFHQVIADITAFEAAMNARFDTVDGRFNILDGRFDDVDDAIADFRGHVDGRLDAIEATLQARFDQIDAQLAMLRTLAITPDGLKTGWNFESDICDGDETADGNCALVANYPPNPNP